MNLRLYLCSKDNNFNIYDILYMQGDLKADFDGYVESVYTEKYKKNS